MMKWKVLNCCGGQKKWMMCGSGGFGELCLYFLKLVLAC